MIIFLSYNEFAKLIWVFFIALFVYNFVFNTIVIFAHGFTRGLSDYLHEKRKLKETDNHAYKGRECTKEESKSMYGTKDRIGFQ